MEQADEPAPSTPSAAVDEGFSRWGFDIVAVIALAVLPDLANCFAYSEGASAGRFTFADMTSHLIVRSVQVSIPLLVIMRLMRVDWAGHGFRPYRLFQDTLVAFGLILSSCLLVGVVAILFTAMGVDLYGGADYFGSVSPASMRPSLAVAILLVACLANGFAEELAMRS